MVPVASAQVKTSLLFAGLLAEGKTTVEDPRAPAITANWPCAPSAPK